MSTSGTLERMPATGRSAEPIVAWRSWSLGGSPDADDLLLRPVSARGRAWRPREVAEAICTRHRSHRAPELDCLCGLHASPTFDVLRRTRCPAVLGRVALWGRVIEHERGYRARFGYPQRLRLICQFCFWQHAELTEEPGWVGWYRGGRLVPFCEGHLAIARAIGLGPTRTLDANDVDQRLRDAYAVDPLGA